MHRVDTSTNIAVLPAPKPAGTPGYFTEGNESSGLKATYPGPDFFNSLQEEVAAVPIAVGIPLSKTDNTQLLQAIRELIARAATYVVGTSKKLKIANNAALPNSRIDVSADELVAKNTTGTSQLLAALSATADITASGANGLDTGAEAASTWYYLWAIAKEDATKAVLLSASATAPTMPAGYTYKALVGAVFNDAGSNFLKFRQFGKKVVYEERKAVLSGGAAAGETAVTISGFVPPIAEFYSVQGNVSGVADGAGNLTVTLVCRAVSGSDAMVIAISHSGAVGVYSDNSGQHAFPYLGTTFLYFVSLAAGSGQSANLWIGGFEIP